MLTELQKEIAKRGRCPYCASHNNYPINDDTGYMESQEVECDDCGKQWRVMYKVIDIEEKEG